ncbi:MAG: hypothetical protein HUU46_18750 [Candidatus Hydrogenedentes bacterium]|nr:hypothetical protein [Candidatus Hydrogenedentota bacterium]
MNLFRPVTRFKHGGGPLVSRRELLRIGGVSLLGLNAPGLVNADDATPSPQEGTQPARLTKNAETGAFDFDTPLMSGSIVTEGPYHGVAGLFDKRSGKLINDSRYSVLNLFKLMAVNLGMGTPRLTSREVKSTDTTVEIFWPATENHQGEITARYAVSGPDTIDLHLTLRVKGTYAGYELLLPNYFDQAMVPHVYLLRRMIDGKTPEADLVVPGFSEVYRGCSLVFPRDAHAARRPLDGRWDRSELGANVAPFFPMRHYAHPVTFMTDTEKKHAAVLMMKRAACSAISARYYTPRIEDRATTYSAVDFLVFGDDLVPGDLRTAQVRLVLTPLDEQMSQPLALYDKFLAEPSDTLTTEP